MRYLTPSKTVRKRGYYISKVHRTLLKSMPLIRRNLSTMSFDYRIYERDLDFGISTRYRGCSTAVGLSLVLI